MRHQSIFDPTFSAIMQQVNQIPARVEIQEMETITAGLNLYREQLDSLSRERLSTVDLEKRDEMLTLINITNLSIELFEKLERKYKETYPEFKWD